MDGAAFIALAAACAVLAWAARGLPWYKLRGDNEAVQVLLWATVAVVALRWFNTDALRGVTLHFIGATAITLMFGPRFALWVLAIASLVAWLFGTAWRDWGSDLLVTGALPVLVTVLVGRHIEQRLPPNLLLYVWIRAFLGGALAIAASNLAKAAVGWMVGEHGWHAYLVAAPPMMFGEGFFCGGALALVVVYRPQWCATFDDARYLAKRPYEPRDPPPE